MVKDTQVRNMWDLADDGSGGGYGADLTGGRDETSPRQGSRVQTRLLGIDHSNGELERLGEGGGTAPTVGAVLFPVGWIVVVDGPGTGHAFALRPGVSQLGRGEDQAVRLDFGDLAISRSGHALVAYDEEARKFFLSFGGKTNLVRLNGKPVLGTEELRHGDVFRIGETSLMLSALCGADFSWEEA